MEAIIFLEQTYQLHTSFLKCTHSHLCPPPQNKVFPQIHDIQWDDRDRWGGVRQICVTINPSYLCLDYWSLLCDGESESEFPLTVVFHFIWLDLKNDPDLRTSVVPSARFSGALPMSNQSPENVDCGPRGVLLIRQTLFVNYLSAQTEIKFNQLNWKDYLKSSVARNIFSLGDDLLQDPGKTELRQKIAVVPVLWILHRGVCESTSLAQ